MSIVHIFMIIFRAYMSHEVHPVLPKYKIFVSQALFETARNNIGCYCA